MTVVRPLIAACLLAAWLGLSTAGAGALSPVEHVDGISDQSLPRWDGSFAASPLAGALRGRWGGGPLAQISLARYVLQWDAPGEAGGRADPYGTYMERFEAWLADVRSVGLIPVLALTSYDAVRPRSPGEYGVRLRQILARAAALAEPIGYVEPWNEPNNQGHLGAAAAAGLANTADRLCSEIQSCRVIAGDFEDTAAVVPFEIAYERALEFAPEMWGVHPYVALRTHDDSNLRSLKANLPNHGAGEQIWFTEVGALYCRHGELLGEDRQAADASYLMDSLIRDPAVAPVHVIYYGLLYRDRLPAPCAPSAGDDSELYWAEDRPRAAASVVLGPAVLGPPLIAGLTQLGRPGELDWPNSAVSSGPAEPLP